jgi:hypothetical protein
MFVPKVLASRIKKDTNTPMKRRQRPVEGKPIECHEVGVLNSDNNGSGIRVVSFGKSVLERENLELKKLVESLSRRLEQCDETVANHEEQNPTWKGKRDGLK